MRSQPWSPNACCRRAGPHLTAALLLLCAPWLALAAPGTAPSAPLPSAASATDADDAQTRERFVQGLNRLREGDHDTASRLLGEVASRSRMAERRAAAAALVAYARKLDTIAGAGGGEVARDLSDGRTEFIVTSTLMGFYAGVVVIDVAAIDDVRPGVATLLLTTGAGFAASLYGSRGLGLRAADGEAFSLGAVWGGATGLLVALSLDVDSSDAAQLITLGGMLGGSFAGLAASRTLLPTRGQVGVVSTTMTLGFASAVMGSVFFQDQRPTFRTLTLIWLGGLQLGTFAGVALAPDLDWSASRARLTMLGGGLGALLGWGVAALATGTEGDGSTTSKIWAGSAFAGMWGGFVLSAMLTEDMAPDPLYRGIQPAATTMVLPTVVGRSPGLALTGRF